MKIYALCSVMWLAFTLNSFAQTSTLLPASVPTLAKKSPAEIESLLGKPHKRNKLREKFKFTTFETDETMSYKTAVGMLGIYFLQESAIAFSHSYRGNKQPADYDAALAELGIDVNQRRPGIFPSDTQQVPRLPEPLKLGDQVVARWQGDFGGVRWERIELHAFIDRYEPLLGKTPKTKIYQFFAVVGGPRLIWR